MKTKIKNIAMVVDNAVEDVNKEYAIEAGTGIANDLINATIAMGASYLYLGSAAVRTAKLAGKTVKTGAKKAIIAMNDYYENSPAMTIYR